MKIEHFSEIADTFIERVHTIVWCNVATVDRIERPRSRVLHPIWEVVDGVPVGWVATGRETLKTKHLAHRPYMSLAYVADPLEPIYADCHAEWDDEPATKQRLWEWFGSEPAPLGYDLTPFFGAIDNPRYGVIKLTPWRIELANLMKGEFLVWKPG